MSGQFLRDFHRRRVDRRIIRVDFVGYVFWLATEAFDHFIVIEFWLLAFLIASLGLFGRAFPAATLAWQDFGSVQPCATLLTWLFKLAEHLVPAVHQFDFFFHEPGLHLTAFVCQATLFLHEVGDLNVSGFHLTLQHDLLVGHTHCPSGRLACIPLERR